MISSWAPSRGRLVVQLVGIVFLGAIVLAVGRTPGLLLGMGLIAVLGVPTLRDLVVRPALAADADGVRVVEGFHVRPIPWTQIDAVRAASTTRLGLRSRALELDLDENLVVLPESRLGADVDEVVARLEQLRAG